MTNEPNKHWSLKSAVGQIAKCDFECEGGPLSMNDAFIWLSRASERGPEFLPAQGVWYEVVGEINGVEVSKWEHFFIVGCRMGSDMEGRTWSYDLTNDPPGPYHCGKVQFSNVSEDDLRLFPGRTEPVTA